MIVYVCMRAVVMVAHHYYKGITIYLYRYIQRSDDSRQTLNARVISIMPYVCLFENEYKANVQTAQDVLLKWLAEFHLLQSFLYIR